MKGRLQRMGILAVLAMFLLFGLVLVASSYSETGVACQSGTNKIPLLVHGSSDMPQSVVDDAIKLTCSMLRNPEGVKDFVSQILAVYFEAKDMDFVIVFNSGGWGERPLEDAPGWRTIAAGIQRELDSLGYKWLALDYVRTEENWGARLDEMEEMMELYPDKAKFLASRVEFLTRNIPQLRVILMGESTGTIISDRAMTLLNGNPRVFSIQTGPPFWHRTVSDERTLVLNSNGIIPDSFSQGDFLAIIRSNLREILRLSQPVDDRGNVFHSVKAPGHVYWWQYPNVSWEISEFLEQNFGIRVPSTF